MVEWQSGLGNHSRMLLHPLLFDHHRLLVVVDRELVLSWLL